jgi:uncharacterized protein (DUF2147 family)
LLGLCVIHTNAQNISIYSRVLLAFSRFRGTCCRLLRCWLLLGWLLLGWLLLGCLPLALAGAWVPGIEESPVGLWKTVDDKTQRPRGVIRIYEENNTFFGRIETSFDPKEMTERCEKCTGDRKDAPIIGLVVMRGITKHGAEYTGGELLDPETGWVYRCRFTLSNDGQKLFVRGYIGFAILGRTQTWLRLER